MEILTSGLGAMEAVGPGELQRGQARARGERGGNRSGRRDPAKP